MSEFECRYFPDRALLPIHPNASPSREKKKRDSSRAKRGMVQRFIRQAAGNRHLRTRQVDGELGKRGGRQLEFWVIVSRVTNSNGRAAKEKPTIVPGPEKSKSLPESRQERGGGGRYRCPWRVDVGRETSCKDVALRSFGWLEGASLRMTDCC
jgi:hypothetical protein